MRRFKGFTLSELMVALAVIGILVAIVTPAIMKNRPNKNKMMVKKTFYTVEQIVSSLINDETLYPDKTDQCVSGNTCFWGFDDTNETAYFEGREYFGGYKFAGLFKAKLNVSKNDTQYPCSAFNNIKINSTDLLYPCFYTSDGVKWELVNAYGWAASKKTGEFDKLPDGGSAAGQIVIDVNGDDPPNCRENGTKAPFISQGCQGSTEDFDRYVVEILSNGKLRISPDDETAAKWVTINTTIRD